MNKKERFKHIVDIGCIVCREFHDGIYSAPAVHHLVGLEFRCSGKKAKWEYTIGLCGGHHQYGTNDHPAIHSHPAEFERKFGTQRELLDITNRLINAK